ncbi:4'-phosphopantetheinyl transferase [Verrucomicrobium sp. GAS474]|nr:4'-phosphopantetheinyl transferase [Verrucomicrobium sp. GAS474]
MEEGTLSGAERERASAFADPAGRARYVVTRLALRRLLGGLLAIGPARIALGTAPGGKPILLSETERRIEFNYGHTDGLALIAVAEGLPIGIDVERAGRRRGDCKAIATRFFSNEERRFFEQLPDEATFLSLWTRKEAVLKALGTGLAGGLDTFSVVGEGRWLDEVECGGNFYRMRALAAPDGYEAALASRTERRR